MNSDMFLREKGKMVVTLEELLEKRKQLHNYMLSILEFENAINSGEITGPDWSVDLLHKMCRKYEYLKYLDDDTDIKIKQKSLGANFEKFLTISYLSTIAIERSMAEDFMKAGLSFSLADDKK